MPRNKKENDIETDVDRRVRVRIRSSGKDLDANLDEMGQLQLDVVWMYVWIMTT